MQVVNLVNQHFIKNMSFSGKRTDKNLVNELTEGNQSLFKPKERQIIEAINRIAQDSTKDNIEFLLSVTENLQYGTRKGSVIYNYLKNTSPLAGKTQNINWEEVLHSAVRESLDRTNVPEKPELEERYSKLFDRQEASSDQASRTYWLSNNPAAQKEAEATRLADKLLKSKEFNRVPKNISEKEAVKLQEAKEAVKSDLGSFLASSEVSVLEKLECLKLFSHFMSPDYKINPQLKDRKVQALSEMLNDIIVQTPEQEMLKSKTVLQLDGICADVSQKKALASEHKVKYVTNVMAELDDKPNMEIYDVTDPKNKIIIDKPYIDFDNERNLGYERILTPATKVWMTIADSIGNGEMQAGKYTGSDRDNYEMGRDSHWVDDMPPELQPKQNLLRAVIKTRETIIGTGSDGSIEVDKIEKKANDAASKTIKRELIETNNAAYASVAKMLEQLLPGSETGKINSLTGKLLDPRKVDNPELKIDSREDDYIKKQKLTSIIKAEIPDLSDEKLNSTYREIGKTNLSFIDSILGSYKMVEEVVGKDKKLSEANTPIKIAAQYERLFKLAAFYRVKKERELDIPDYLAKTSCNSKEEALKQLEKQGRILPRRTLNNLQSKFAEIERFNRFDYKNAARGGKKVDDRKIYFFSKEQINAFDQIKDHYGEIKKEVEADYKALNRVKDNELEPHLKELYTKFGQARGHFWVGEEGHSGLGSDQQVRIMTQMAGVPYYIEQNLTKALDHLEAGLGGAASSTSVSHTEIAGHAQYVNDIGYVPVKDLETGEISNKRALFHDNTWGPSEKDGYDTVWGDKHKFTLIKDAAGNLRTDYGRDFGGPGGFIFSNNYTTGTLEDYFLTGITTNKPDQLDNPAMKKLDKSIGVEYGMFWDMVLKGDHPQSYVKATNTMKLLVDKNEVEEDVEHLLHGLIDLKEANVPKMQAIIKKSGNIETRTEQVEERLLGLIEGSHREESVRLKLEKGINSRKDYDKIPDDHFLKLMLRKASMLAASKNSFQMAGIGQLEKAQTQEDLDKAHKIIVLRQKVHFDLILKQPVIAPISELKKSPTGKALINWIDQKFDPKDDKEFMEVYKNIAGMDKKQRHKLLNNSTDKELGVVYEDPCTLALRIKGKNENAENILKKVILGHVLSENLDKIKKDKKVTKEENKLERTKKDKTEKEKLEDIGLLYRNASVMLSHLMKVRNRQDGIDRFGARPAIPELTVYKPEELKQGISDNLLEIGSIAQDISVLKQQKNIPGLKPKDQEEIDKQLKNVLVSLKQATICSIKVNVIPREQNTAMEMVTKWLKAYTKNPESEESKKLFDDITNFMVDKHLTNHPKEMLDYIMTETPKMANDEKNAGMNNHIVDVWADYLTDSLKASHNAYIEFNLMEMIDNGEMQHVAAAFKDPNVKLLGDPETGKPVPLTSPSGMAFIIANLMDPANSNNTLKFFIQQTGLTNNAVETILGGAEPRHLSQVAKAALSDIKKHNDDMNLIMKATEEFQSLSVDEDFDINDPKAVANLYFKIIDKPFEKKGMTENETLKRYKENISKSIEKAESKGRTGLPIFNKAQSKAIKLEEKHVQKLAANLKATIDGLNFKNMTLTAFNELLPDHSELKAKSIDHIDKVNKALTDVVMHSNQLNKPNRRRVYA